MPTFEPPRSLDADTNLKWRKAARDSFENPKLLRSRYWRHYNTITIPIQSPDNFYTDAIAAAQQSFSRDELEDRLETLREERIQELKDLMLHIYRETLGGKSANVNDAAAEITDHGSIESMLKMICGLLFGWNSDDTSPLQRSEERNAKRKRSDIIYVDGGQYTAEDMKHAGEHSDEDWDMYKDDDDYYIRECEDSDEELSRWRFNRHHGIVEDRDPMPDYELITGRGWVPKDRPKKKRTEMPTNQRKSNRKSGPSLKPTATTAASDGTFRTYSSETTPAAIAPQKPKSNDLDIGTNSAVNSNSRSSQIGATPRDHDPDADTDMPSGLLHGRFETSTGGGNIGHYRGAYLINEAQERPGEIFHFKLVEPGVRKTKGPFWKGKLGKMLPKKSDKCTVM